MKVERVPRALRQRHELGDGQHDLGKWYLCVTSGDFKHWKKFQLWHYSTLMLEWVELETSPGHWSNIRVTHWSTGHGTVTDQQTMNVVFRELDIQWYFSRKGGSRIVPITDVSVPKYTRGILHA